KSWPHFRPSAGTAAPSVAAARHNFANDLAVSIDKRHSPLRFIAAERLRGRVKRRARGGLDLILALVLDPKKLAAFAAAAGRFLQFPIGDRRCNRTRASVGNAGGNARPSLTNATLAASNRRPRARPKKAAFSAPHESRLDRAFDGEKNRIA